MSITIERLPIFAKQVEICLWACCHPVQGCPSHPSQPRKLVASCFFPMYQHVCTCTQSETRVGGVQFAGETPPSPELHDIMPTAAEFA